jgi:hypothetical protein
MGHYASMKRTAATLVLLTAYAVGQPVVLAPPDQQEHHAEHVGTFAITYEAPPPPHTTKPTLVLDMPGGDVSCYTYTDFEDVLHSYCEDKPRSTVETVRSTLYLRNFHGVNGAFVALPTEGAKCDPLRSMVDNAITAHLNSVTFEYKESHNAITVACAYVDSKGHARQGTAKYDVIAAR